MAFGYEMERLGQARRALMLPVNDVGAAYEAALTHCWHAFENLKEGPNNISEAAREHVALISQFKPLGGSLEVASLSFCKRLELSSAINALADWAHTEWAQSL